ncbi:MAG: pilus assembly protein PilM [Planctomycetes bacterium]|nr:pilus assembly protein PilM [Planctomycetota bacterium]
MISRSQRVLGLDIGSSTVKGVELAKNGEKFAITGYAQAEIASAGTLKEAIAAVLRDGRFKSKQVVSSVSGRSVIVRYINTPVMKPDELKSSMRFEADKYIPFELNEVILDCLPLGREDGDNGEMRVVLVAVKKEIVDEHVRILQEVGLYPCVIDVDCFALGNAFELATLAGSAPKAPEATEDDQTAGEAQVKAAEAQDVATGEEPEAPSEDPETKGTGAPAPATGEGSLIPDLDEVTAGPPPPPPPPAHLPPPPPGAPSGVQAAGAGTADKSNGSVYALVDIGAQKTNINIMRGDVSSFTREVYIGGEDMTEAVSKHLSINTVDAEIVKREGDQEAAVLEAIGQTLDDLANEIFLSFDYFENQFDTEIKTVYLSGGGSRLKGIGAVFSDILGRQVLPWDPVAGIEVSLVETQAAKLRENASQLAVAMGLASRLRKV